MTNNIQLRIGLLNKITDINNSDQNINETEIEILRNLWIDKYANDGYNALDIIANIDVIIY